MKNCTIQRLVQNDHKFKQDRICYAADAQDIVFCFYKQMYSCDCTKNETFFRNNGKGEITSQGVFSQIVIRTTSINGMEKWMKLY